MYSYSLDFICLDPLGSTNYGKLTNVQINVETEADLGACGVAANQQLFAGQTAAPAVDTGTVPFLNANLQANSAAVNMSHASMVETLYMTGNCNSAGEALTASGASAMGGSISQAFCEVPYQLVLTAVNNNIIRISGGALGFPVL